MKNPYSNLLVRDFSTTTTPVNYSIIEIYKCDDEWLQLLVANPAQGKWTIGYRLYFADGRQASRLPTLEYGYCRTKTDAVLYFTGQLLTNGSPLSDNAREAAHALLNKYRQQSLF